MERLAEVLLEVRERELGREALLAEEVRDEREERAAVEEVQLRDLLLRRHPVEGRVVRPRERLELGRRVPEGAGEAEDGADGDADEDVAVREVELLEEADVRGALHAAAAEDERFCRRRHRRRQAAAV